MSKYVKNDRVFTWAEKKSWKCRDCALLSSIGTGFTCLIPTIASMTGTRVGTVLFTLLWWTWKTCMIVKGISAITLKLSEPIKMFLSSSLLPSLPLLAPFSASMVSCDFTVPLVTPALLAIAFAAPPINSFSTLDEALLYEATTVSKKFCTLPSRTCLCTLCRSHTILIAITALSSLSLRSTFIHASSNSIT